MQRKTKIAGIIGWVVTGLLCINTLVPVTHAINWDAYYNEMRTAGTPTSDAGVLLAQTNQRASLLERLLDVFAINYAGDGKALSYIQIVINYVLSFTAFIALLVILYGFYMMFFRDQDKGFGTAKKTVTGAAIALFVIGISWLFVNFAFYVFNQGF